METLLAKLVESKLSRWLRAFSRDQFRLQGRIAELSNLELQQEVFHNALGLPPMLHVEDATVSKLTIKLPSVANIKSEPLVVSLNSLDIHLVEREEPAPPPPPDRTETPTSGKGNKTCSDYSLGDKIVDGITILVDSVHITIKTLGKGGHADEPRYTRRRPPPVASITLRGLVLRTTNELWQVVNLRDCRKFSRKKPTNYVFKTLEWTSLVVDLLPNPEAFALEQQGLQRTKSASKRHFFGGERIVDEVAGTAKITLHSTWSNEFIAVEVDLDISDLQCPAMSEPGLRSLLVFATAVYTCINRSPPPVAKEATAAARSLVCISVDHILMRVKDLHLQLEVLMRGLKYSRVSPGGVSTENMAQVELDMIFIRDLNTRPPTTLLQPIMDTKDKRAASHQEPPPDFAGDELFVRVYPIQAKPGFPALAPSAASLPKSVPMLRVYIKGVYPPPTPPQLANQLQVRVRPCKLDLNEQSSMLIASILSEISVNVPFQDESVAAAPLVTNELSVVDVRVDEVSLALVLPVSPMGGTAAKEDQPEQTLEQNTIEARIQIKHAIILIDPTMKVDLMETGLPGSRFGGVPGSALWRVGLFMEQLLCDLRDDAATSDALWRCIDLWQISLELALLPAGSAVWHPCPDLAVLPLHPGAMALAAPDMVGADLTGVGPLAVGLSVRRAALRLSKHHIDSLLVISTRLQHVVAEFIAEAAGHNASDARDASDARKDDIEKDLATLVLSDGVVRIAVDEITTVFHEDPTSPHAGAILGRIKGDGFMFAVSRRHNLESAAALQFQSCAIECVAPKTADGTGLGVFDATDGAESLRAVLWVDDSAASSTPTKPKAGKGPSKASCIDIMVVHSGDLPKAVNTLLAGGDVEHAGLFKVRLRMAGVRLGGGVLYSEALLHRLGFIIIVASSEKQRKLAAARKRAIALAAADNVFPVDWERWKPDIDVAASLEDWLVVLEGIVPDRAFPTVETTQCVPLFFKGLHVATVAPPEGVQSPRSEKRRLQWLQLNGHGLQVLPPCSRDALQQHISKSRGGIDGSFTGSIQGSAGLDVDVRATHCWTDDTLPTSSVDLGAGAGVVTIESVSVSTSGPAAFSVSRAELRAFEDLIASEWKAVERLASSDVRWWQPGERFAAQQAGVSKSEELLDLNDEEDQAGKPPVSDSDAAMTAIASSRAACQSLLQRLQQQSEHHNTAQALTELLRQFDMADAALAAL